MTGATERGAREPALDILKVAGIAMVFLTHACASYVPGLSSWPRDWGSVDARLGSLITVLHPIPMPLFFIVAGFTTARGIRRVGPTRFLCRRVTRLFLALAAAVAVICPLTYGLMVAGRLRLEVGLNLGEALSCAWDYLQSDYLPHRSAAHTWFLSHLLLFSLAAILTAHCFRRRSTELRNLRITGPRVAFALTVSGYLFQEMNGVVGFPEISGFIPTTGHLVLHGTAFGAGILWSVSGHSAGSARNAIFLGGVVAMTALASSLWPDAGSRLARACCAVAAGATVGALIELAAITTRPLPAIASFAGQGLVIYLVHVPVCVLASILVRGAQIVPTARPLLATLTAGAGTFLIARILAALRPAPRIAPGPTRGVTQPILTELIP